MATLIAVTVDLPSNSDTETQTIEVPSDIKWSDFELMLRLAYEVDSVIIKYVDEDNDQVTISSDEELREAFRVAQSQLNTLQLKLIPTTTTATARNAPPSASTQPVTIPPRPEPAPRNRSTTVHPGVAKPVPVTVMADTAPTGAISVQLSASSSDDDDSLNMMEGVESSKDTASSTDSSPTKRLFFLRHSASGLVLDVQGWERTPGTRVIIWEQKFGCGQHWTNWSCENQLFLEDEETGTIRSYFCGLCLDANETGLTVQPFNADKSSQRWKVVENRLQNGSDGANWVIGLADDAVKMSAQPKAMTYQGNASQHWELEFVDEGVGAARAHQQSSVQGSHSHRLFTQLAEEMAKQLSSSTEDNPVPVPPEWFNAYMDKFKRDICEEISTLVTRKTVRQVLQALHNQQPEGAEATSGSTGSTPSPWAETEDQPPAQHYGIICDSCDLPIQGVRYKCGNCEDFDLCEMCESRINETKVHDPNHVFVKLRRPTITIAHRRSGRIAPLLKRPLYPTEDDIRRLEEKILRKHDKHRRRGEKHEEKLKRREEKLKRRHEAHRDTPSKKEKLDVPYVKGIERMDAEFVEDENFPDGSQVAPDCPITKCWVMKNTGVHAWDKHTKLTLMWGNIPVVKAEVEVPPTKPNENCHIEVDLITPTEPGVYQSHWRMSQRGARFGHRVWCSLVVTKPENNADSDETTMLLGTETATSTATVIPEIKEEEPKPETEDSEKKDEQFESDEAIVEDMIQQTKANQPKEKSPSEVDILSAQDILSFEMLDIRDRNTPKVSQTATPTNTPMAGTPPKSPIKELEEDPVRHLSTSSSVEIVSESSEESTSHMTELVQERIAKLGLKPDHLDDLETMSNFSEDSNDDSDSDFYIVPLPDCFNPTRPLSSSTTSIVVTREEVQKTVDDILTASKNLDTPSLVPEPPRSQPTQEVALAETTETQSQPEGTEMAKEDTLDDVSLLAFEMAPSEPGVKEKEQPTVDATSQTAAEVFTDENANSVPTTPESTRSPQPVQVVDLTQAENNKGTAENPIDLDDDEEEETQEKRPVEEPEQLKAAVTTPSTTNATRPTHAGSIPINAPRTSNAAACSTDPATPPSPSVLASSLMTAALGVASQAAATAYTTAKDVFNTLQANNNQYVPPKSNWKPPQQKWSPPKQDFTLPKESWTPPAQTWTPPAPTQVPPQVIDETPALPAPALTPMEKLVEMGFANRDLNRQLLAKHGEDLQKVVQELVNGDDTNWHLQRH